jgi:OOP family OmpA-OmpF porin
VRDSFRPNEGGTLRTFTVGEHTVQVEAGPRAILAAVIRGQAPESVTERQQRTLETLHYEFATPLAEFSGDAAAFEAARPLLAECLETVVSTKRTAQRRQRVWLRWALPLAAVGLAAVALSIRARTQWTAAVRTLEGEPGIVVVDASRGWGGWRFAGLRDPLAREPRAVLATAGFPSRRISERWERYLSLDSAIVVERARRSLAMPPSVQATLAGGTLAFTGSAPIDWIGTVRGGTPPPGADRVDLASVTPTWPAALDSVRREIESTRILFAPGSAELGPDAERRVAGLAGAFARLAGGAGAAGAFLGLTLLGRTDPTGSDATNQSLAQWRVDAVRARLQALGVPIVVDGQALATSRPLDDADPARRASINRSVSFALTLSSRAAPATRPRP